MCSLDLFSRWLAADLSRTPNASGDSGTLAAAIFRSGQAVSFCGLWFEISGAAGPLIPGDFG